MADHTHIEWTDATWNPITGCSIVSPGCTHCYAMRLAGTRLRHHPSRAGLTKDTKAGPVWTGEVRLNWEWMDQPLTWTKPRMIFVCAHGDLFHKGVPMDVIAQIYGTMIAAHHLRGHTFQVLTKRSARARASLSDDEFWRVAMSTADAEIMDRTDPLNRRRDDARATCGDYDVNNPPPGIWLGVSAEDQRRADERIPDLLATPAAVRFVSAEPLLGPIDFQRIGIAPDTIIDALDGYIAGDSWSGSGQECAKLDWIIVGGESGPGARPMHPDWARSIRDQCAGAGAPFFFKQWGEWAPNVGAVDGWALDDDPEISRFDHREWDNGRWSEPFRPMWCDWTDGNYDPEQCVSRIGKARAGRMLDGVEHNAMPEVQP